jgi:RsiW-degrading membrane proteinase PrsW (M82 family)
LGNIQKIVAFCLFFHAKRCLFSGKITTFACKNQRKQEKKRMESISIIALMAVTVLPSLLLFLYIRRKDSVPEPNSQLLKHFGLGMLVCFPVAYVENLLEAFLFNGNGPTSLAGVLAMAFLVAALPEEGYKLSVLHNQTKKNPHFDEHFDGIVYAVCIGLGFATVENIAYVFDDLEHGWNVAIGRALLSVPGHYAFGVIMGYCYARYFFIDHSWRTRVSMLLMPVMAHGIYDTLALSASVNATVGGVGFLLLIAFCIWMHKKCIKLIKAQLDKDKMAMYERWKRTKAMNEE